MKKTIISLITILAACTAMQAQDVTDNTTRELTKKEQKAKRNATQTKEKEGEA